MLCPGLPVKLWSETVLTLLVATASETPSVERLAPLAFAHIQLARPGQGAKRSQS
jgi:hypothetical protein